MCYSLNNDNKEFMTFSSTSFFFKYLLIRGYHAILNGTVLLPVKYTLLLLIVMLAGLYMSLIQYLIEYVVSG